jgi:hypothetical protein
VSFLWFVRLQCCWLISYGTVCGSCMQLSWVYPLYIPRSQSLSPCSPGPPPCEPGQSGAAPQPAQPPPRPSSPAAPSPGQPAASSASQPPGDAQQPAEGSKGVRLGQSNDHSDQSLCAVQDDMAVLCLQVSAQVNHYNTLQTSMCNATDIRYQYANACRLLASHV